MEIRNTEFIKMFNVLVGRRAETNNNNYKKAVELGKRQQFILVYSKKIFLKK